MKILQVIKELAQQSMTILMASHFPDHAFLVSNVVAILNNGRISKIGPPDAVVTEENMRATYGVDVQIVSAGQNYKACIPQLIRVLDV